jgi:hypothetical protein
MDEDKLQARIKILEELCYQAHLLLNPFTGYQIDSQQKWHREYSRYLKLRENASNG